MAINIRSFNQVLGQMINKIVSDTPLNDLREGSALLTLLEAAAQSDFENNASILSVLELLSIDAIRNNDLDARAADYGLSRITAQRSTGFVTISDSRITKRTASLYQVKPAPIAGSAVLFVNDASSWEPTGGELFIGRGTSNFEGPIQYSSIINNGSFYTINLNSALQKDHLFSEIVVDGQSTTDRLISQNTRLIIPPNNQNPTIEYRVLRNAIIPAGEDSVTGVPIISIVAGASTNAGINNITRFSSPPFSGATVTNPSPLTDGRDVESDEDFRERIKSYANSLARGTKSSILSEIVGVSDSDDGKQVNSATITEPPRIGDPSIIYIDDGTGFQPSFAGQSVDQLLTEASGNEEFLQLANFPLPRPQVINAADGPFEMSEGMTLRVLVDGVEEEIVFSESQFVNSASATLAEVIIAINDQSSLFNATFTSNSTKLLLFPSDPEAETIQVSALRENEDSSLYSNSQFKFPTDEFSYIRLYKNNVLLNERARSATLLTTEFSSWNIIDPGNIIIEVDSTPPQNRGFTTTDFGGQPLESLTLNDWVSIFNSKFAGLTATATSSGRMQITSNRSGSLSKITITGGFYFDTWFTGQSTTSDGRDSDFELNRQNGNIRILTTISEGDFISAGSNDTKGSIVSTTTPTGSYNIATDASGRLAEAVIVADSSNLTVRSSAIAPLNGTITISDEGSSVMRVMSSSLTTFNSVLPGDFVYLSNRGSLSTWIDPLNAGIYKIVAKGSHTSAGTDTYVEVKNSNIVAGSWSVDSAEDIHVFKSDSYPQIWKGTYTSNPASAGLNDIISSFEENLVNVVASIFKTNSIKLTSTTEAGGSIAVPVSVGNASLLFSTRQGAQEGNQSQIANRSTIGAAASYFKRTQPSNTDIWLGRYVYTDVRGSLTADSEPGVEGVDAYGEQLASTGVLNSTNVSYDDVINITDGSNKGHYRSVRDLIAGDTVGTQYELPKTVMDYTVGEDVNLMRPLTFYPDDSIVSIIDQDSVSKTIEVRMSRTGRINNLFTATDLSFSADDAENEDGITFSNLQVWGKDAAGTEFENYALWFRARNWYVSGGVGSGGGSMLVRAKEYGPHGENVKFGIEYPAAPALLPEVSHFNFPEYTEVSYTFGSDIGKPTGIQAGYQFSVTNLGGNFFRYSFTNPAVSLSQIAENDIVTLGTSSGVSASNRGTFRISAADDALKTIDIYNPNGSATLVGTQEVTQVDAVDDIVGSATVSTVQTVSAASLSHGDYFIIEDAAGLVAIYYAIGSLPTPPGGVNRTLVVTLTGTESDIVVASLTNAVIAADSEFFSSSVGNVLTINNADNVAFQIAADSIGATDTGFSFGGTLGTNDNGVDGQYFILQDQNGSVAFWYDTSGATSEPLHGADRSVEISTVSAGDSANTVASKTAVIINNDAQFSAVASTNEITVTDAVNGVRSSASAGTTAFTVSQITAGVDDEYETISVPSQVKFYALLGTAVQDITDVVSTSPMVEAVVVDDTNDIVLSTKDENYTPAGPLDYSASLSYGHDPASLDNDFISLYDSISWVKDFQNSHPNFAMKKPMLLQGVAPSVYSLDSAVNRDDTELGEYFKLVPVTLNNVYHHFTQKALSQLPIVADVDIASNIRGIQVKSKIVGSGGAVEIVGGNANSVSFSMVGEGITTNQNGTDYLQATIASSPVTLTEGSLVRIDNTNSAQRLSRLVDGDTVDVTTNVDLTSEYRFNPKNCNLNNIVRMTVTDVSASYSRAAGTVWRWQHKDAGSKFRITSNAVGEVTEPPNDYVSSGLSVGSILLTETVASGSATVAQQIQLSMIATPNQADYFVFEGPSEDTFAVWFDIDANGTAPTGGATPYGNATHKIKVDILSSDSQDQIISKLASTLLANGNFNTNFIGVQLEGANFDDVAEGDMLLANGDLPSTWPFGNRVRQTGNGKISGFPVVAVNSASSYIDVVNPDGVAMTDELIDSGLVQVTPTPFIEWRANHFAKTQINSITVVGGAATAKTTREHYLEIGDTVVIEDSALAQTVTVTGVTDQITFEFTDTTAAADDTYDAGFAYKSGESATRYRIESLGFNNLFRLQYVSGRAPRFVDCGVAVDDLMIISGSTFSSNNSGTFRVLAVDDESVIYENALANEQLHYIKPFNNLSTEVTWTSNLDEVSGAVGSFKNVSIGDWVKKTEDSESRYVQVIQLTDSLNTPTTADLATKLKLGGNYTGTSAEAEGVAYNQISGVDAGHELSSAEDVRFIEGDSARVGDTLFVDNIANSDWFSSSNAGSFSVQQLGISSDLKPFLRVDNELAAVESNVDIGVSLQGFFLLEGEINKYSSIRVVEHSAIDENNENRRKIYMTPDVRTYKLSQSNGTTISSLGKLSYPNDVTLGIDGYTYYTGLLRTVQRIVDGFEPDPLTYPGRRAVGSAIEILGPLPKRVSVALDIVTKEGVNLNEISNDIKSAIIDYVDDLGVGDDVILSEITVRVMEVSGVESVVFTTPSPSVDRIAVADNEKPFITSNDIDIA